MKGEVAKVVTLFKEGSLSAKATALIEALTTEKKVDIESEAFLDGVREILLLLDRNLVPPKG